MAWPTTEILPITVQLDLAGDGTWSTDITSYVIRDPIEISGGRGDWADDVDPATARFTLNNRDGRFSPRNPTGPYYGQLTRNTPVRVGIGSGTPDWRFCGELSSLPQRWDNTGTDVHVPVSAADIFRRLGIGQDPTQSSYKSGVLGDDDNIGYWPMEDAEGAIRFASGLPNGSPMDIRAGTPDLASYEGFDCSAPLAVLNDAQYQSRIGGYRNDGFLHLSFLLRVPDNGSVDGETLVLFYTTGEAKQWAIRYFADATNGNGAIGLRIRDEDDTILLDTPELFTADADLDKIDGEHVRVTVEITQTGADIDFTVYMLQVGAQAARASSVQTVSGADLGRIRHIFVNPGGGHDDVVIGHLVVKNALVGSHDTVEELNAHVGEAAGRRVERLSDEHDLTFVSTGDLDDTALMGPQQTLPLIDLFRSCAATDAGMLYSPRDQLAVGYRTRRSIENQTAQVTLDYDAEELVQPFEPVDDDQRTRNDVTVTRPGGSSARAVRSSGAMSVDAPPDGVGRYTTDISLNPASDLDLADHAGFRLHLGTVDEARYPTISVNRARAQIVADATLSQDIVDLEVGDRVDVTDLPAWLPPEDATQIVQGYDETIAQYEHSLVWQCTPQSPWQVAVWPTSTAGDDDEVGAPWARFGPVSTLLAEDIGTATTGFDLDPGVDEWTSDADHYPFDILIGGEQMTATAMTAGGGATDRFEGDGNASTSTASTSHVAPSVDPDGAADLMICAWCSYEDVGNYTVPGSMTEGTETDGVFTTMTVATETLAADTATGTRTATFSAADAYSAVSVTCYGAGSTPTVEEALSGIDSDAGRNPDDVTLTTAAGTEVGWWLIAIHAWDWDPSGIMPNLTGFDGLTDSEIGSDQTSRIRVGVKKVETAGAQSVVFPASPEQYDNHARLYVVSGVAVANLQVVTVTRSVNGVVKTHSAGAAVRLFNRAVRPLA